MALCTRAIDTMVPLVCDVQSTVYVNSMVYWALQMCPISIYEGYIDTLSMKFLEVFSRTTHDIWVIITLRNNK